MIFKHELLPEINLEAEMINGKRHYLTPSGKKYPSVTTVLSPMSAAGIAEWRARVGEDEANRISSKASSRGTKVHLIAENYVMNRDYKSNVMPSHIEMFHPVQKFLDKNLEVVYGSEIALYSDRLKMAGRCDLVCGMFGIPTIVDFKTARQLKEERHILNYFFQTTIYGMMVKERHGMDIGAICILIATEHDGLQVFHKSISHYKPQLFSYLIDSGHLKKKVDVN